MAKVFHFWDVDYGWLLPPSLHEFVPPGHTAHFVQDMVWEALDLSASRPQTGPHWLIAGGVNEASRSHCHSDTLPYIGGMPGVMSALTGGEHAGRLEGELAATRAKLETVEQERDIEGARVGRIEVLEGVLEIERNALKEAHQEASRRRKAATAPRGLQALVAWVRRSSAA
jgi:hypothetical protein